MRIAIPIHEGVLCAHFGQSRTFAILDVDDETKSVVARVDETPPMHEPGVLPEWLDKKSVDVVIAGGMGMRAQQLFNAAGVQVITGAPSDAPETIAEAYLKNELKLGPNTCGH